MSQLMHVNSLSVRPLSKQLWGCLRLNGDQSDLSRAPCVMLQSMDSSYYANAEVAPTSNSPYAAQVHLWLS